jgi:flagellar basal body-associated protein FliL
VNIKLIILTVLIGLVGFGGMFAFAWFTKKPAPQPVTAQASKPIEIQPKAVHDSNTPENNIDQAVTADEQTRKAMTEKQLKSLVYEIREKIENYNTKIHDVEQREQRLQTAQDTLKQDIEKLNNLRIELTSIVASYKDEQDKLQKSRVAIAKTEKENLVAIATFYDKMEPESAGKILTNIQQSQNSSSDDAVKILYYMNERTKAKVIASIAQAEPAVSAYFCQKLKQVSEQGK